jgi:hypothetical protein
MICKVLSELSELPWLNKKTECFFPNIIQVGNFMINLQKSPWAIGKSALIQHSVVTGSNPLPSLKSTSVHAVKIGASKTFYMFAIGAYVCW